MSTKIWNVGIIGCGAISRNHIEAVQAIDGAEVTAVCDVDATKAQETAEKYGIASSFDSVDDILASGVDIVAVCTPHPTHEAVVLAAAAAGVHVLCEKPIAIELESAQRMIDACESAGVQLGVLFQRRFWPAAQKMKKELVDGSLGHPIMGQCTVALYRKHSYYTATPWRGTWEADGGGVLMTQAIHYIDLMCWLLGEPAEVFGYTDSFKHGDNIEVEDSAVATVRFESGALATISATTAAEPALGAQVQVMGTQGATMTILEFPEGTEGRLIVRGENDIVETTPSHPSDLNPNADLSTINGALIPYHTAQIADFIDALNENREPLITGRDATKALKVLLGVYESAATHLPVSLI